MNYRLLLLSVALPCVTIAAEFDPAAAVNHVGLDLYRQLAPKAPSENLVLSPYSISSALALAYSGADGATRTEMAGVLQFPADNPPLQAGFASLRASLHQIAEQSKARAEAMLRKDGKTDVIEWHAANRLFGQKGYAFRQEFLTLMKEGFEAPFEAVDFRSDAERVRGAINGWVEDQTRRKIRDLIPQGGIHADTRLVLVNALYLKAPWQEPFKTADTQAAPFHLSDGSTRDVPTMHRTGFLGYAAEEGLTVVALDYLGGELQFLILLPDPKQSVDVLAAKLTPEHFARWAGLGQKTRPTSVSLYLPKFRVEGQTVPLSRELRALGMKSAFDEPPGSAHFDRIAPRKAGDALAISNVFHQTFIAVDEAGTEAAAATAVVMLTTSALAEPPQPIEVRVDRPFLFAIQHRASRACLFLGRITDPR